MNTNKGNDFINQIYAGVPQGAICATLLPSKQNIWFDVSEKENISDALEQHSDNNCYLSLCIAEHPKSAYKRIARNDAAWMTVIVADIDVYNPEAHTETQLPKTKEEGLEFIKSWALPDPSAIIDTGNGYQVFWFFDKPLEINNEDDKKQAERLSFGLNKLVIAEGIKLGYKLDNVGDLARIFRAPNTFNVKGKVPVRTFVQEMSGIRYSIDQLASYLPKPSEKPVQSFKCFEQDIEYEKEADLEAVYNACEFIRRWVDEADKLPEPEWYAGLSIVARTMDGIEKAHKISSAYPNYSMEETERKIRQARAASGPATCQHIHKIGFSGCLTCPLFYSKNLKSPITLGFYEPALAELLGRFAYNIQTQQFAEAV